MIAIININYLAIQHKQVW